MMKDNVFTKYDLETGTPDEIQFEIMEMPLFFVKMEKPQSRLIYMVFIKLYGFNKG